LTPQPVTPAYFAFLGRISPEKGVDQAIWIAKRCGVPLKIAAKIDAVDRDYFESEIRKLLTPPDVEYIGEINDGEKSSFLSGAIALLAPIACLAQSRRAAGGPVNSTEPKASCGSA
jgi:glycosyltransferase involved in cell wall biosynthesis